MMETWFLLRYWVHLSLCEDPPLHDLGSKIPKNTRERPSSDKTIHYSINIHIIVSINSQYQYTIFQYKINWRTSRLAMANFATSFLQIMSSVASSMIDVHPGTIIFRTQTLLLKGAIAFLSHRWIILS